MEQKILLISGKKQSGKTSLSNFIHGYVMQKVSHCIEGFKINEYGDLIVPAEFTDSQGNVEKKAGIIDLENKTPEFINFASQHIWPYVRAYSFADTLKGISMRLFGLTYEQCYGTDEDKNTLTEVKWKDISFALPPRTVGELKKSGELDQFMTAREFMQEFGTNICRKIRSNCWAFDTMERVVRDGAELAIIADCRFPDELDVGVEYGAKSVRLLKKVGKSTHKSETALDKNKNFDFSLDNSNMDIADKNMAVLEKLIQWEFVPPELAEVGN